LLKYARLVGFVILEYARIHFSDDDIGFLVDETGWNLGSVYRERQIGSLIGGGRLCDEDLDSFIGSSMLGIESTSCWIISMAMARENLKSAIGQDLVFRDIHDSLRGGFIVRGTL
jgi:hypothetical protein